MPRSLVLLFYNIALPVFFVIAFPAWLLKMLRRGGYGTGLLERFGKYGVARSEETKGGVYIHAVSVGEVLIALKLIRAMRVAMPDQPIVLAATTSTGHSVAREKSPAGVRVIYSPLDFNWTVRSVLNRFTPNQIVLMEAEAWPNLLRIAQKKSIPVSIANARLSERSERRLKKFGFLVRPVFGMISNVCVQNEEDAARFEGLGIAAEKITVTGSIKFDPSGGGVPEKQEEYQLVLDDFGSAGGAGRPVIMVASSHAGEEKLLAAVVKKSGVDAILVVVPRHAERRAEVARDVEDAGMIPVLRSKYVQPEGDVSEYCLVVDSTGELRNWTAHADWVIIGKSWLGEGGQNPAEAIAAGVPVICGPHMGNFKSLIRELAEVEGVFLLGNEKELIELLPRLVSGEVNTTEMTVGAKKVLDTHSKAIEKTLELVQVNASVGVAKGVKDTASR